MQYLVQPLPPRAAAGPLYPGNQERVFAISNAKSGLALTADNTLIRQRTWKELPNQQWKIIPDGDGTFRVQNVGTGLLLEVASAGGEGSSIMAWTWNGGGHQKWRVLEQAHGHFRLDASHTGLTMAVANGSISENEGLISARWDGETRELWILSEVRTRGNLAQHRAVLFEHPEYQGASQAFGIGSFNMDELTTIGNDRVSSLRVPDGFRVTLYEHPNYTGRRWTYTEDCNHVGRWDQDKASSVVVDQVASIFEQAYYHGPIGKLGVGSYNGFWEKIEGELTQISVAPSTVAWGVNAEGKIYYYDGTRWHEMPGRGKDVGVGANGTAWVVGTDGEVYRRNGGDWERKSDNFGAHRIAVDPNGYPWVVTATQRIYRYDGTEWRECNVAGRAKDVGVGVTGVAWVIGDNGLVYRWNGSDWELKIGISGAMRIAVDPGDRAWVVQDNGKIFRYNGSGWVQVAGAASDIGIGPDGTVWIVGTGNRGAGSSYIYRRYRLPGSLKVPAGLLVTLYENSDCTGESRSYTEDATLLHDFHNRANAITVKQIGVTIPKKVLRYGGSIQLKSCHGKWLVAESDGRLRADRPHVSTWETFTIWRSGATTDNSLVSFGDIISLKSFHSKFVTAEGYGGSNANRDAIGPWEQFQIFRSGATAHTTFLAVGDRISLKSVAHNRFMIAEPNGDVNVNSAGIGPSEIFEVTGIASNNSTAEGGGGDSSLSACGAEACGADACGADACGADACGADACGAAACGVAATLVGVCGAAAAGIAICGADVAGIGACVAAACGAAAVGIGACGADACGAAACGAAACGAAACGAAACGADACGAAAGNGVCGAAACGADACGAEAGGIEVCPVDLCGANACAINLCPADACAADACALDIIPIIPGI